MNDDVGGNVNAAVDAAVLPGLRLVSFTPLRDFVSHTAAASSFSAAAAALAAGSRAV